MTNKLPQPAPCHSFADLLVDYSDNELPAEERQIVNDHLASCTGCQAHLARLDASRDTLLTAIQLPAHRASTIPVAQPSVPRAPNRARAAWAAAALVAVISAWLWYGSNTADEVGQQSVAMSPDKQQPLESRKITPDQAVWHIALVEQQARLEASLAFLPRTEAFASQREQDERLLARFQTLVQNESF